MVRPAATGSATARQVAIPRTVRLVQAEVTALRPSKAAEGGAGVPVGLGTVPAVRVRLARPSLPQAVLRQAPPPAIRRQAVPAQTGAAEEPSLRRLRSVPGLQILEALRRAVPRLLPALAVVAALRLTGVAPLVDELLGPPCAPAVVGVAKGRASLTRAEATAPLPAVARPIRKVAPLLLLLGLPEVLPA